MRALAAPPRARPPAAGGHTGGRWQRVLAADRLGASELAVVGAVLGAVGAGVFGSHIVDGGFYYDDWANSARTQLAGGYGDALASFWGLTGYRPLLAFYVPTLHEVLGEHTNLHLAWATLVAVAMSAALCAVLVELGVARLHALAVGALVLVFPYSDSTRLWATSATAHLTAALWLAGLWLALRAFDPGRSPRSVRRLHAASLALYLASLTLYELTATLMLASGVLYLARAGWRRGAARWVLDVAVVAPVLAVMVANTGIETTSGRTGWVEHARIIGDEGWQVIASGTWPFTATDRVVVTAAALAVVVVAAAASVVLGPGDPARDDLRRWLVVAGGGLIAAWTAWAVFVPSDPYYSPGTGGVGNRVNVLAAMGIVTFAYAVVAVAVTLLLRAVRAGAGFAPVAAFAAAVLVLGGGYVGRVLDDKAQWAAAARAQSAVLDGLRAAMPDAPPGSVLFTFGHPTWWAPGVPVFASSWDLDGAIALLYDDPSVGGYPALPLTTFDCRAAGASPQPAYGDLELAYGSLYFVDVPSRRVDLITDADDCRTASARFRPGPS